MRKLTMTNKYSGVGWVAKIELQIGWLIVGYFQIHSHSGPSYFPVH